MASADKTITLPAFNLKGRIHRDEIFWSQTSVLAWLYEVRDALRKQDCDEGAQVVDAMVRHFNTGRVR